MEVKINSELRKYSETIFFGLTLRQFLCTLIAVGLSLGAYFLLRDTASIDVIGWACILISLPFALFGFLRYQGLPLERVCLYFIRSEILSPKEYPWAGKNGHIKRKTRKGLFHV